VTVLRQASFDVNGNGMIGIIEGKNKSDLFIPAWSSFTSREGFLSTSW
jgi:hypothetical protein